jgi:hypothetical protein
MRLNTFPFGGAASATSALPERYLWLLSDFYAGGRGALGCVVRFQGPFGTPNGRLGPAHLPESGAAQQGVGFYMGRGGTRARGKKSLQRCFFSDGKGTWMMLATTIAKDAVLYILSCTARYSTVLRKDDRTHGLADGLCARVRQDMLDAGGLVSAVLLMRLWACGNVA